MSDEGGGDEKDGGDELWRLGGGTRSCCAKTTILRTTFEDCSP